MEICRRYGVRIAWLLALAVIVFLVARPAAAQTFRGTILGTVTDTTGAAIVGATVEIQNVDTGLVRTTETGVDGSYVMPELPIGNYRVTVERKGFQVSVTDGVRVDVAVQRTVNAQMKTGNVEQKVVVSAETQPQVETASDTLGGVMQQQQVTSIPANGRDYQKLIFLTPGVAGSPDEITDSPGSYGVFSMNGARGRSNNFLLDGTDMNDGFRNDPAINEAGVFGDPATILPLEAISELHVLSNYEAEYGRNAGAVVNIVTKSGTNQFHGSALEYFRNTSLNARNYFNDVGTPKSPFHNNQFGASLGGPIIKDKTFFFFDYEGQRESGSQNALACVPNPAQLQGSTNSVITALIARDPWPTPNIAGVTTTDTGCSAPNLSTNTPFSNDIDSLIGKIDHSFNQNNLLSGRYYFGNSTQLFPLSLTGGATLPGFNTYTPTRVQLVSISDVWTMSPTRVNEARLGWNRFAEGFFPQDRAFDPASIGLDTGSSSGGIPVIDVGSFAQIGANNSTPRNRVDANWHFIDNISWKIGKNDLKFGYEFRRTSITQNLGINSRGILDFDGIGDFLAGTVEDGSITSGNGVRHTYQNNHGLYVQDAYKLTSTITVNAGLRWDYYGVFHEKNDLLSNFYPTQGLVQVGTGGVGKLYQPDYRNFAPRLSAAWDVRGRGRTVLRAGWGMFFDAFSQDIFLDHLPWPSLYDPGPAYNPTGPAAMQSGTALGSIVANSPVFGGFGPTGDAFGVDPNIRTPYMENYNLNLQQQISKKVVFQIGYVGSQGHRLFRFVDLNQPNQATIDASDLQFAANNVDTVLGNPCLPAGGNGCIPAYGSPRNFPQYPLFYIFQEQASAKSNYNSLQSSIRINDYRGFSSQINYVWSHSIDNASDLEDFVPNAAQPNDSTNPNAEKGNSNFDVRNRFSWNYMYRLPNRGGKLSKLRDGWGIDGAVILQAGQPFALNYDFEGDFDGSGEGDGRPDVAGPITYNRGNPAQFLDLTSFMVPCTPSPVYTEATGNNPAPGNEQICVPGTRHFGNEGRGSLRGPSFKEADFAVFKDTPITEHLTAQFRCEIFNLLNHPNFASPLLPAFIADAAFNGINTSPSSATYGHSTGYLPLTATGDVGIGNPFLGGGAPRGIQFAVKFMF
ncbi:MAG TPA: carboxypeptidase regulatory-like domain-containing protein [Candidatus Aquilonibacter sp.]|nr:carboxypeptidase regulatory-like domain-containing protein [Candidatus Aquilonibacter sp.]